MTIDLGPAGKAGIEARTWSDDSARYCYIAGSDHWRDWLHHVLPGARRREIAAARAIVDAIYSRDVVAFYVGGHSLGGAVAQIVSSILTALGAQVHCYSYGGKRAPRRYSFPDTKSYRHAGDIVPFLPPWRPKIDSIRIGTWKPFWLAHQPREYGTCRQLDRMK